MSSPKILFGFHAVGVRLKTAPQSIVEIYFETTRRDARMRQFIERAQEAGVRLIEADGMRLAKLAGSHGHQGVAARVESMPQVHSLDDLLDQVQGPPLLLVLDRVTDVRNFGAIARTAECTGVNAIVIPDKGAAQINADAMKTSSGALNFLPVCRESSLIHTVRYLQDSGIQVVACSEKVEKSMYQIDFKIPTAIIMGSEEDGISDELIRKSDDLAVIPQSGQVGSLNVSVAAGVVIFETVRQRSI